MFKKWNEWILLSFSLNSSLVDQDVLLSSVFSTEKAPIWIETMKNTHQLETDLGLGFHMVPCEDAIWCNNRLQIGE